MADYETTRGSDDRTLDPRLTEAERLREQTTTRGSADYRETADDTVRLHEEELTAEKRRVQAGEVSIRKEVVSEQRTVEVPVTREEVVIERHAVDRRPATDADFGSSEESIRVPVMSEQVQVEKRPVVTEEISVGKRAVQDTQQFDATVRREEAFVEHTGEVGLDASETPHSHGDRDR